ncbi:hypothetical protein Hanom_Chr17g01546381 [Helianthus anomalus]
MITINKLIIDPIIFPCIFFTSISINIMKRVKCYFSPCGLGHFASLVQMFHFSHVGPKRFHRRHFSPLG